MGPAVIPLNQLSCFFDLAGSHAGKPFLNPAQGDKSASLTISSSTLYPRLNLFLFGDLANAFNLTANDH